MARFTLVVRPDGKALLTCQDRIPDSSLHELRDAIDAWREEESLLLVVTECDVVQVVDIEIDVPEPGMVPA